MNTLRHPSTVDFDGLTIAWDERVLEPRAWTVAQPDWLAELSATAPPGPVLELFCGAGQMGIALARATGRMAVLGDLNPVACAFARANARTADVTVEVRHASVEATAYPGEQFALMLLDPPWVTTSEVGTFPEDPVEAIDGGHDGLVLALLALRVAATHLAPGGHAVLQLGHAEQVDRLWSTAGAAVGDLQLRSVRDHRPGGVLAHLHAPDERRAPWPI